MQEQRRDLSIPLSIRELNDELGKSVRVVLGDNFIHADRNGDNVSLRLSIDLVHQSLPEHIRLYRITDRLAGTGVYKARSQMRNGSDENPSTDLDLSTYYSDITPDVDDVTLVNVAESHNPAGTHALVVDGTRYVLGKPVVRETTDQKNIVEVDVGSGALPTGQGQYKCLMLLDNTSSPAVGWDWPRFHQS